MIASTLPDKSADLDAALFRFGAGLIEAGIEDVDEAKPHLRAWLRQAGRSDEFADAFARLLRVFQNYNPAKSRLRHLLQASARLPVPARVEEYGTPALSALARLCMGLAKESASGEFFLDQRSAGAVLGVSHVQAGRLLKVLLHEQVLNLTALGDHAKRLASCYRWVGAKDQCP